MHIVEVQGLQLFGNRPSALAGADHPPVDLANRCDLCGGTGKERFIRNVDLVAGDAFLHDLEP